MRGESGRASQAVSYFASPLFHFSSFLSLCSFPFPRIPIPFRPQKSRINIGNLSDSGNFLCAFFLPHSVLNRPTMCRYCPIYPLPNVVKLENHSSYAGIFLPY